MRKLRAILVWILRAWPLIVICIVFSVHWLLLKTFPENSQSINGMASLLSQILGGILVLYSIDSAIGLVKKGSLLSFLLTYLGEFPLFKRSVTIFASGSASIGISGEANLHVTRRPGTVEERLENLQEQITEARQEISAEIQKMQTYIECVAKEAATGVDKNSREIGTIRETLEKSATDGVKEQVFGVLLVLYGSIAGYVT